MQWESLYLKHFASPIPNLQVIAYVHLLFHLFLDCHAWENTNHQYPCKASTFLKMFSMNYMYNNYQTCQMLLYLATNTSQHQETFG